MDSTEIVKLEDVWVYYNSVPVLKGITMSVDSRDFLGVIGPNGGGKTTLLKVLLGLVKPSYGQILVLGDAPQKTRHRIGYVPQHNLFDHDFPVSVWDVVLMGRNGRAGLFARYNSEDKLAAEEALHMVQMIEHKNRQIGSLSGGEQQRVFIARALVTDPAILLLDEPTASVDPVMQTEFYEMLDNLKSRMAIVLVSHDISAVSIHVDKLACLNQELFHHGSSEIEAEVLEATYKCPVQMISHGAIPHRVLKDHQIHD